MIQNPEAGQMQPSMIRGSGARDYVPSYSGATDHHPQILMPMSMAPGHSHLGSISTSASHPEHYSGQDVSRAMMSGAPVRQNVRMDTRGESVEVSTKPSKGRKAHIHSRTRPTGMSDSPGKMNPQAATFAPSYMKTHYSSSMGHPAGQSHLASRFDSPQVARAPSYKHRPIKGSRTAQTKSKEVDKTGNKGPEKKS